MPALRPLASSTGRFAYIEKPVPPVAPLIAYRAATKGSGSLQSRTAGTV